MAAARFEYDLHTAIEPLGDGRAAVEVSPAYSIGPYPNGGYVLGVILGAVGPALPHPDPLAISAHFLRPTSHGRGVVEVDTLRRGRAVSTAEARLLQDSSERVRVLATYGDLAALSGPTVVTAAPPALPPLEECPVDSRELAPLPNGLLATIRERFEIRMPPGSVDFQRGERSGRGEIAGYLRFADGREPDTQSLALICDAFPPAVFDLVETGWVPTIELTVLVRSRPVAGWLRVRFRTTALVGGLLEEDGEVWDAAGHLVAQSRQLARANPVDG